MKLGLFKRLVWQFKVGRILVPSALLSHEGVTAHMPRPECADHATAPYPYVPLLWWRVWGVTLPISGYSVDGELVRHDGPSELVVVIFSVVYF